MAGDRDLVMAFQGMDRVIANLANNVPRLRGKFILADCGHWTQQERASEVNAAMIDSCESCERACRAAGNRMMRRALWNNHPEHIDTTSRRKRLAGSGAILRRAFAAQFGMPPDTFWTDRDFVTGRWMTDTSLAFGAWMGDRLVGSSLGTSWGSLGIFGPISTHPDTWNHGPRDFSSLRCSSG